MVKRLVLALVVMAIGVGCAAGTQGTNRLAEAVTVSPEKGFSEFLDVFVPKFSRINTEDSLAWWQASITGTDADFQKRLEWDQKLDRLFSNRDDYLKLKAWRDGGKIKEPVLKRQLEILYLMFLGKQVDIKILDRMSELSGQVDQIFNTFRADIGGKKVGENEIRDILAGTKNAAEAEAAWKAFHAVGRLVDPKLRELVALRNQAARSLGFKNYYVMQLALQELDEAELVALFDELDNLTRDVFVSLKGDVDRFEAARFGTTADKLRPWSYGDLFFQEAPKIYPADLDNLYKGRKIEDIGRNFYDGLGLNVDDILARSDLYEKSGKSPHAFCADIDRLGDIRTLMNLTPTERWMGTMLHELGHSVYSKYINRKLPYVLRDSAHIFTTEAVAMFFGRQSKDGAWIEDNLKLPASEVAPIADSAAKMLKLEQIMFSRWAQVMMRFERSMYDNPDQDLSRLWWDLKAKYQLLTPENGRSEPDYAAKIHIVSVPAYYHNYMLGELYASQLYATLRKMNGVKPAEPLHITGKKDIGEFFRTKVFEPGASVDWRTLVKGSTGEPLSAKAFSEQFLAR